ncbi:MAG: SIS domain-containing protein [Polyangia bacterium]|jgi:D-sedoheptulose 7-phosphate isomerase
MMTIEQLLADSVATSIAVKEQVASTLGAPIAMAARMLVHAYQSGNKAIFFGNGGSAADAQHLAAEMECRFAFDRPGLPALALAANSSTVTAVANDYAFEQVYARLLAAHARPGDVAVAISTSGASKNVVAAARSKDALGLKLIALTGADSMLLAPYADCVIAVPSRDTPRVQEAHITIGHVLCQWVEHSLFQARDG